MRPYDGEGDSGESSATTEIEDFGSFNGGQEFGDGETVEDMVGVEVVDVFAGNDIDFLVPFGVKLSKLVNLGSLPIV